MIRWARGHKAPMRVVDAGAGTGQFTFSAAAAFPDAEIVAIEVEPRSAAFLREARAQSEHRARIQVLETDFLRIKRLRSCEGPTLFIGNPPYVRHHRVKAAHKRAYIELARELGLSENTKAGLHLHFFLHTRRLARPGDFGIFIAAAEWLHADYGSALRNLLLDGMGGLSVDTFAAHDPIFPDVMTTAAVVCFEVGLRSNTLAFSEVHNRQDFRIGSGAPHAVEVLAGLKHWSGVARGRTAVAPSGRTIELGELFQVRRGQVTGANDLWIDPEGAPPVPSKLLHPCVTRAKEIIKANGEISDDSALRAVVDLPVDLRAVSPRTARAAIRFREWARRKGAADAYVARYRKRWWSVQLYDPADIICTYMARRAPVFALNTAGVRHINIAHGLYAKQSYSAVEMRRLVKWLNGHVSVAEGRSYAGGLIKFEPSDISRIRIPLHLADRLRSNPAAPHK
jgi:Eco57I restriction-modification methylase